MRLQQWPLGYICIFTFQLIFCFTRDASFGRSRLKNEVNMQVSVAPIFISFHLKRISFSVNGAHKDRGIQPTVMFCFIRNALFSFVH